MISRTSGEAEGCVAALTYPNSTAWVAFFIVNTELHGHGLGRDLWKELKLVHKRNGTSIVGLDAVQQEVGTYTRRGFRDCAAIPYLTRPSVQVQPIDPALDLSEGLELKDLRDINPTRIAVIDFEHTGLDRTAYWEISDLINRPHSFDFAIISHGQLTGFIYVHRCENGHHFGPLYAASYMQAKQLLVRAMTACEPSESYCAEIFGANAQGQKMFNNLDWAYSGVTYRRMWLDGRVPIEQREGSKGQECMYAIFDAACGLEGQKYTTKVIAV